MGGVVEVLRVRAPHALLLAVRAEERSRTEVFKEKVLQKRSDVHTQSSGCELRCYGVTVSDLSV